MSERTAWLPLDPATSESGCMSFVPGSHVAEASAEPGSEVRVHRHVDDDPSVHALVTDDVDATHAAAVPLPAGGASFHLCRVLHSSAPNRSNRQRRAYAIEFQTKPAPRQPAPERPWIAAGNAAWHRRSVFGS